MPQLKIEDSKCHSKDPAQPNKLHQQQILQKKKCKGKINPTVVEQATGSNSHSSPGGSDSGLGHAMCPDSWDVSDRDTSGHFKCSCPVHLTFLHFRDHMKRIYLVCPLVSSEQQILRINLNPLHDLESSQIQPDPGQNSEAWARNKCLSLFPTMVFVVGCSIAIAN